MIRHWLIALFTLLLAAGCIADMPAPQPAQGFRLGDVLFSETFETATNWTTYDRAAVSLRVTEDAYEASVGVRQYVWGTNRVSASDVVVETVAYYRSDDRRGLYGVMCRANAQGHGYYFVVAANGNYSIRRLGARAEDALVKWQAGVPIKPGKQRNIIRAVCAGDYLALYVNGVFVADTYDDHYQAGYVGVAVGKPQNTPDALYIDVNFDSVRAWDVR